MNDKKEISEFSSKNDIKAYLVANEINPTLQRIRIFEYLYNNRIHPTVDQIFKDLYSEIPTLSKTTVYNTLSLFNEKGIISAITIEDNEVRYDANISSHIHFKCVKCKNVFDIFSKSDLFDINIIDGHQILNKNINFIGICKNCFINNLTLNK